MGRAPCSIFGSGFSGLSVVTFARAQITNFSDRASNPCSMSIAQTTDEARRNLVTFKGSQQCPAEAYVVTINSSALARDNIAAVCAFMLRPLWWQ